MVSRTGLFLPYFPFPCRKWLIIAANPSHILIATAFIFKNLLRSQFGINTPLSILFLDLSLLVLLSELSITVRIRSRVKIWTLFVSSFAKIQSFLTLEEVEDPRVLSNYSSTLDSDGCPAIQFYQVLMAHRHDPEFPFCFVHVSFLIGTFTLIYGPNSRTRTRLLKSILGESDIHKGTIQVSGQVIGYCGQPSWILNKSIRANIIAHRPFDQNWYQKVLDACCLTDQLERLPRKDEQNVGRNGKNVSDDLIQLIVSFTVQSYDAREKEVLCILIYL